VTFQEFNHQKITKEDLLSHSFTKATAGKKGKEKINDLSAVLKNFLNPVLIHQLIDTAKKLMNEEHMYLIGKYLNFPATLEFALKIKETSYIHAEPFAAGELKHGVITLIQKETPCFVLASNDENRFIVCETSSLS